jgi:GNAT superfamily N-acetyltransferase
MPVTVTPVAGKQDRDAFLRLPARLYADDPHAVLPLYSELRGILDKDRNPFYSHAETELWLARRDGRVVGRIAACVDRYNNEHHDEQVGFFGFFETEEDPAVSAALLAAARDWIAGKGMTIMRGPGCFTSNHDWYGLQVDGTWNRPVVGMPYNPRTYPGHLEDFGLRGCKDLYAWHIRTRGEFPEKMQRLIDRILARPGLVVRPFDMKNFMAEASIVRDLYNRSWSANWGFIPLDDAEFQHMAKDMKSMVDPAYLLIAELDGEPIGFSVTIPDFNEATQSLKGELFPFGWLRFLLAKRKIRFARTLLMGVLPEHRKLGVDMALVYRTMQAGFARGVTEGECSWVLDDNKPMNRVLEGYGADRYKTYRVYEMPLD